MRTISTSFALLCLLYVFCGHAKLNNSGILPTWFSSSEIKRTQKPKLTIPTFVNYGGNIVPIGPTCIVELQAAVDASKKAGILSNYDVLIRAYDDRCDHGAAVTMMVTMLNTARENVKDPSLENMVPMMLGPMCAYQEYTANIFKYYNFVMVSDTAAVSNLFHNRVMFESFFAYLPSYEILYDAVPAFLASHGWKQVFLLTETYPFWSVLENKLIKNFAMLNLTLAGVSKVITLPDTVPDPELFEVAIRELAAHDARIIVVNSDFGSLVACWFYRLGMYGPKYVFLIVTVAMFLPNAPLKSAGCTDRMLFEVLKSVIVFTFGFPLDLYPDSAVDSIGTSGRYLLNKIVDEIDEPQRNGYWYYWKGQCYDQTIAGLLALDAVDKRLRSVNDSLLNWVTSSEKFRQNGSFIYELMKQNCQNLTFDGMCGTRQVGANAITGITAFHQIQVSDNASNTVDLTDRIKMVVVATYDSSSSNPSVQKAWGTYNWRTPDGHPPYDSLRVQLLNEPVINVVSYRALITLASLLLVANAVIASLNVYKWQRVKTSLRAITLLILVGNELILCFVFVFPVDGLPSDGTKCMAAVMSLIVGSSLMTAAIQAKMEIAMAIAVPQQQPVREERRIPSKQSAINRLTQNTEQIQLQEGSAAVIAVPRQQPVKGERRIPSKQSAMQSEGATQSFSAKLKRTTKFAILFVLIWSTLAFGLTIAWFVVEPLVVHRVDRQLEMSGEELSLAYAHSTNACVAASTTSTLAFIGILIAVYLIGAIRSVYLAFALRRTDPINVISDLNFIRIASYATTLIIIAGGTVIVCFFLQDPGTVIAAISALSITVVFVITSALIVSNLRPNQQAAGQ